MQQSHFDECVVGARKGIEGFFFNFFKTIFLKITIRAFRGKTVQQLYLDVSWINVDLQVTCDFTADRAF